jgi:HemY protein
VIRIVFFLVVVAVLAFGAAWVADRPGEVVLTWQGWQVSTSLAVAGIALAAVIVIAVFAWSAIRFVLHLPDFVTVFLQERRRRRGWRALSRGMIAVGAGNLALAQRSASEARALIGEEPLTLLLAAQAAQLGGDAARAEQEFRAMLPRPETKVLGLRGLYVEARRRGDGAAARAFAEEAAQSDPALPWAADAQMEFQCLAHDWPGALATLDRGAKVGAVDKATRRRWRAVLLTAQAQVNEETRAGEARESAREAAKLAPTLVPAAAVAGRLLGAAGELRRAARIVEKAWASAPHPDLAEVYIDLRPGDAGRDRLKRAKALAKKAPGHSEAALAVARAALDAHEFDQARMALAPLLADPTRRVCLLMAEIEASEHGDQGKAREWTARAARAKRDPAWVADGYLSERWLPISPVTGKLDAFVWMVPPEAPLGPLLEHAADREATGSLAAQQTAQPLERSGARLAIAAKPAPVIAEAPLPDDPGAEVEERTERRRFRLFEWLAGPTP